MDMQKIPHGTHGYSAVRQSSQCASETVKQQVRTNPRRIMILGRSDFNNEISPRIYRQYASSWCMVKQRKLLPWQKEWLSHDLFTNESQSRHRQHVARRRRVNLLSSTSVIDKALPLAFGARLHDRESTWRQSSTLPNQALFSCSGAHASAERGV